MIQTIETERDAIVSAKSKSQQTSAKKIKHLVKLKSIGQSLPQCSSAKCSIELLTTANKSEAMLV
jgi:hypothetical protein